MGLYLGLMSGTSMDGIDAVLVDLRDGSSPHLLATRSAPFGEDLRGEIAVAAESGADGLDAVAALDARLGECFADAALALLASAGVEANAVTAIGSHGQTVRHRPPGAVSGGLPFTVQIGDPNRIAAGTGIPTVADFRRADMAVGGQGAPLVPAFHRARFADPRRNRVVLNLGGMANVTLLPAAGPVSGFDTGPGNVLLDAWVRHCLGRSRDDGGRWAATGRVRPDLLRHLLDDPYFRLAPPKSTGREHFDRPWLQARLQGFDAEPATAADVQATLCELTAVSVADAVAGRGVRFDDLLVCGGGVHNATLMERLRARSAPCRVASTAAFGIEPDWVEAIAFAWLARETLAGRPGNVPAVTGARREVVLGGVYAPRGIRRLAEAAANGE